MSESVRVCDNCGARHIKVLSWINEIGKVFWFCNLTCKQEFMQSKYPELVRKRDEAKSVLPQVRSFVARKTKGRITVVRGHGDIRGGTAAGKDQRQRGGSG